MRSSSDKVKNRSRPKATEPASPGASVTTIPTAKALMLEDLARSDLTEADAATLGLEPLDAQETTRDPAPGAHDRTAYRIPYHDPDGKRLTFYRLRFTGKGHTAILAEQPQRYSQPPGTAPELYLPPLVDWRAILRDPAVELVITEGEKKAACACKHGFNCLGIGGVWSWLADGKPLDSLGSFAWKGRRVSIVYDADSATKPQVVDAAARLAAELVSAGADAHVGFPSAGGPKGLDDLIVAQGPDALRAVLAAARPLRRGMWPLDMAVPGKMFPHRKQTANGPGAPIPTIESVQTLLEFYGIEAGYNVITKTPLYRGRGFDTSTGAGVQHGAADQAINRIISQARLCAMPTNELQNTVHGIAFARPENPVLVYLRTLPPPTAGEPDALRAFAAKFRVPADEQEIRDAVFRLWMIQACATADYAQETPISERRGGRARPTFEYVLTLLGNQGATKTSTLRALLPLSLRDYFGAGVILNPDNKDSVERATGFWVCELGEIDGTVGKAANASLKAFLSQPFDVYRKSYGRERNSFPRQTAFAATGNILRSLRDITGSRRFWPVNVIAVTPSTDNEIERAWAQAWSLYLAGEQWWPDPKLQERLDAQVIDYAEEFPLAEKVLAMFGPLTPEAKRRRGTEYLTAFGILEAVGRADLSQPDPKNPRDIGAARELGNWLTRANLNAKGEPDRRRRAHTSEWCLPKREPSKPSKVD